MNKILLKSTVLLTAALIVGPIIARKPMPQAPVEIIHQMVMLTLLKGTILELTPLIL